MFDSSDIYQVHAYMSVGFICTGCGAVLDVTGPHEPASDAWCEVAAQRARVEGWYVPPPDAKGDLDVVTCFCANCAVDRTASTSRVVRVRIFVALLGEAVDVWRPVDAVVEGPDAYRIISQVANPDERWQFVHGDIVRCEPRRFADGSVGLAAIARVSGAG
jgi:hypothetical protein